MTAGFHHAIAEGHGIDALPRFVFLFLAIVGLLGWIVMRMGMIALWLRAAAGNPAYPAAALRYAAGIALAQVAWSALYFATAPGSSGFFASARSAS